jgi:hypothetical protein
VRRLLILLVVVLVNLPAAHEKWTDHEVAEQGRDVEAVVVDARSTGGRNLVDYTLPEKLDPDVTVFSAAVDDATYRLAVETDRLAVRAVPGKPGANRPDGQVHNPLFLVAALSADVIFVLVALLARHRRRRRAEDGPDLYDLV